MEGVEAVDGAGDAIEGDAFEADFANQLGYLDGRERRRGGGGIVGGDILENC